MTKAKPAKLSIALPISVLIMEAVETLWVPGFIFEYLTRYPIAQILFSTSMGSTM
jgi:hypothetical protein